MRDDCDRRLTVLWALRIFGPTGSHEIARRTRTHRSAAMGELARLVGLGFASNVDASGYDITDDGRAALQVQEAFRWVP